MKVKFNQFKTKSTRNSDSKGSNIMKKNRKLTALLVAACMTIPMAATTFTVPMMASGATDITLSEENSSLEAYQIFKGTYANGVLGVTDWGDAFGGNPQNFLNALKTDNAVFGSGENNIFKNAITAIDVADVLGKHSAHDSNVAKEFVRVAYEIIQSDQYIKGKYTDGSTTKISLEDGYYMFADPKDSTVDVRSFGLLKVVGNGAGSDVSEKRALPTVTKQVREAGTDSYADYADCEIGEEVQFQITCKIPESNDNLEYYSAYYLEIQDTLGEAFDTPTEVTLTIDSETLQTNSGNVVNNSKNKEYKYELTGNDIKITMEDVKDYAGKDIVLTYKAKLNGNAQTGNNAFDNKTQNINSVKLIHSNNPYEIWQHGDDDAIKYPTGTATSTDAIAKVFTYQLDIHKFATNNTQGHLAGAKFKLLNKDKNKYLYMNSNVIEWVALNSNDATVFESTDSENISIKGLDADTYYLEETEAPAGYNKLTDKIQVKIDATFDSSELETLELNETDSTGDAATGIVTLDVENKQGAQLPETGGIGTKIFYVLGGTLVIGSGAALVIKKRMGKDEE